MLESERRRAEFLGHRWHCCLPARKPVLLRQPPRAPAEPGQVLPPEQRLRERTEQQLKRLRKRLLEQTRCARRRPRRTATRSPRYQRPWL